MHKNPNFEKFICILIYEMQLYGWPIGLLNNHKGNGFTGTSNDFKHGCIFDYIDFM